MLYLFLTTLWITTFSNCIIEMSLGWYADFFHMVYEQCLWRQLIVDSDLKVTFIQSLICIVIVESFKYLMFSIRIMYFIMVLFRCIYLFFRNWSKQYNLRILLKGILQTFCELWCNSNISTVTNFIVLHLYSWNRRNKVHRMHLDMFKYKDILSSIFQNSN